ncbi:P-loop containing nucleoside triphosphate hydrolase protein [Cladochytrium replicatum]|nr:P-loop containing nucleoside triphosphate hydrolase protein [Cladochytrium replicatum]
MLDARPSSPFVHRDKLLANPDIKDARQGQSPSPPPLSNSSSVDTLISALATSSVTPPSSGDDCIRTYVRVRPWTAAELHERGPSEATVLDTCDNSVIVGTHVFTFDYVGAMGTEQAEVFQKVGKTMCDHALAGYNATIFAYGQTGTGKTFTMQGPYSGNGDLTLDLVSSGLVQRSIRYILQFCPQPSEHSLVQRSVRITSYVEIYNEQVYDLLDNIGTPCTLREDPRRGFVQVYGATERHITTPEEAFKILQYGVRNRTTFATEMNRESSRSHSVLTLTIQSRTIEGIVTESRLSLVDLAGSERQRATSTSGERLREGGHINKSLLSLSHCLSALIDLNNGKARHIPFRDSKLTLLLKDSLGGNAKSCMIANISPSASSIGETLSTLRFASRAKLIKNRAVINFTEDNNVAQLQQEIRKLRSELDAYTRTRTLEPFKESSTPSAPLSDNVLFSLLETAHDARLKAEQEAAQLKKQLKMAQELAKGREQQVQSEKMIVRFREAELQRLIKSGSTKADPPEADQDLWLELRKLKSINEQLLQSNPDITQFAIQVMALQDELSRYRHLEADLKSLNEQKLHYEEMESGATTRILDQHKELKKLQDQLLAAQTELSNTSKRHQAELQVLTEREVDLSEEIQLLKARSTILSTSPPRSLANLSPITPHHQSSKTKPDQIEELIQRIASLEDELASARQIIETSERQTRRVSDNAQGKYELLQGQLEAVHMKMTQLTEEKGMLIAHGEEMCSILKESRERVTFLESTLATKTELLEVMNNNIAQAKQEIEILQRENDGHSAKVAELELQKVTPATNDFGVQVSLDQQEQESRFKDLLDKISKIRDHETFLAVECARLEAETQKLTVDKSILEDELADAVYQRDRNEEDIVNLKESLQSLNDRLLAEQEVIQAQEEARRSMRENYEHQLEILNAKLASCEKVLGKFMKCDVSCDLFAVGTQGTEHGARYSPSQ